MKMGAVKLPELHGRYQNLQNKVWRMEHRNQELEIDYQAMQRRTIEMTETHNTLQQNFDALSDRVNELYNEKRKVEQLVSKFKITNRK